MPRSEQVILTYHDRIAVIRINKPERLNACDLDNYYDIGSALREIDAKKDVYITVITGTGRYFSAGADINSVRLDETPEDQDKDTEEADPRRRAIARSFVVNNLDVTNTFNNHSKIIIFALNGPAVGLSAALVGFADFCYAAPHAFLLTPFASLGLVTEGGASIALAHRLGPSKANEALIMGKKISCQELVQTGFVNRVFEAESGREDDSDGFLAKVFAEIDDRLGRELNQDSMLMIKDLIRAPYRDLVDRANVREVFTGLQRFWQGIPQEEFAKLATGQKRHKM